MIIDANTAIKQLEVELEHKRLILFAGAGVSIPSNIPTWSGLGISFVEFFEKNMYLIPDGPEKVELLKILTDSKIKLSSPDTSDYISVLSVLKNKVFELDKITEGQYNFKEDFRNNFQNLFAKDINNWHETIVQTDYSFIITTNYDMLFENAGKRYQLEIGGRSYGQDNADKIAESIFLKKPSIIHLHGKADATSKLETLVLTSDDYTVARSRFPGFTLAIQALLMKHSVFFVGYGGKDPNVENIFRELALYFDIKITNQHRKSNLPGYYLMRVKEEIDNVTSSHKESYGIDIIETKDYTEQLFLLQKLCAKFPRKKNI
jgi:NAD-dependent SIR2 family protein deacetylase